MVTFKIQRWSNKKKNIYIYIHIYINTGELVQKFGCDTINMRMKKSNEFMYIYRLID